MDFSNVWDDPPRQKKEIKTGFCTIDGHLNSPITADEVDFLLKYDEFYCGRHKHIKGLLTSTYLGIKSYRDIRTCSWSFLEDQILRCELYNVEAHEHVSLQSIVEAAIQNSRIQHHAYFGREMNIEPRLNALREVFSIDTVQRYYRDKVKVEKIKSALTDREHILGDFYNIAPNISIEKEITIIQDLRTKEFFLFPTTMVICVLDNLQSRFHLAVNVAIKERFEGIPGLFQHYLDICHMATSLRETYGKDNSFFDLMKDWDARIIGMTVEDDINDLGFTSLTLEIEDGWKDKFSAGDLYRWIRLITCQKYSQNRDEQVQLSFYFANLNKNFGYPILSPIDGIKQLRENSKKEINIVEYYWGS